MGETLSFFQSPETSPDWQDFSNILENGVATISANCLGTLRYISLEPIDLLCSCSSGGHVPNLHLQQEECSSSPKFRPKNNTIQTKGKLVRTGRGLCSYVQSVHLPSSCLYLGFFSFANRDLCSHFGNIKIQAYFYSAEVRIRYFNVPLRDIFTLHCFECCLPFNFSNWAEYVLLGTPPVTSATTLQGCCYHSKWYYEIVLFLFSAISLPFLISRLPVSFICITTSNLWKRRCWSLSIMFIQYQY